MNQANRNVGATMNTTDAIRYLAHEAKRCRDRDAAEALCLLFPALCELLGVKPMDDFESIGFHEDLKKFLASRREYKVDATCVECGRDVPLPISSFVDGQARQWCNQCAGERTFLLHTLNPQPSTLNPQTA